jgi:hypothetical protein
MGKVDLAALLGDTLLVHDGNGKLTEVPISTLSGKTVAVYFSAHWCGRWVTTLNN